MGNQSSKSSIKNNNLSKQINFVDNNQQSKYSGMKSVNRDNDALTKFTWNYGGNSVYLTGSFNNWKKNIPMEKQGDQFSITLLLPRQIHQYKFIVDGEWRFSPEDATMSDDNGYINNYIDTTNFQPLIHNSNTKDDIDDLSGPLYQKQNKQQDKGKDKKQQYAKYAPKLPPHYQYCLYLGQSRKQENILNNGLLNSNYCTYGNHINHPINSHGLSIKCSHAFTNNSPYQLDRSPMIKPTSSKVSPAYTNANTTNLIKLYKIEQEGDQNYEITLKKQEIQYLFNTPHSLPMPTHIVLDHAMIQKGEWYSAMAITQRFKQKYTTFVYYTMNNQQQKLTEQNVGGSLNENIKFEKHKSKNMSINNPLSTSNSQKSFSGNQSLQNANQISQHGQYHHIHPHKKQPSNLGNLHHLNSSTF